MALSCKEAVVWRSSVKKVFLEISQNSQENTWTRVSVLIKFQAEAWIFIKKETLAQVLSWEFSEISKNSFSHRTPLVAASAWNMLCQGLSDTGFFSYKYDIFYHKRVVTWKLQHFYHKEVVMLSFLHRWDYC